MNKYKRDVIIIVVSVLFISVVIYFQLEIRKLNINHEYCTVGILQLKGRNKIFHYDVNGIQYKLKQKTSETYIISGEKYRICYDVEDPSTSVESLLHPIIDTSNYVEMFSLPLSANLEKGNEFISFEYIYNGDTFKRGHKLIMAQDLLIENKQCKILVNKENPRISYINLSN